MAPEVVKYDFAAGSPAVRIEQDSDWNKHAEVSTSSTGPAFGLQPWASSQILCRLLALGRLGPLQFGDSTVIEVGAGCGLPGLLLAAQRRHHRSRKRPTSNDTHSSNCAPAVLLTDYHPQVLDTLCKNVKLNGFDSSDIEVAPLDFRKPNDCQALQSRDVFDLVIAADVAYDDRLLHDMLHTFALLCRHGRESHAGAAASPDDSVGSHVQRDDVHELRSRRPPCRVLLACESRARDAGVRLLKEARDAGFHVEGPLDLPSDAFRWGTTKQNTVGRPADVELQRVQPDRYGVLVLTLADTGEACRDYSGHQQQ